VGIARFHAGEIACGKGAGSSESRHPVGRMSLAEFRLEPIELARALDDSEFVAVIQACVGAIDGLGITPAFTPRHRAECLYGGTPSVRFRQHQE
jgi:hypothetical protein